MGLGGALDPDVLREIETEGTKHRMSVGVLREMVAKTFPPESTATVPDYVAARLPSGCLGP